MKKTKAAAYIAALFFISLLLYSFSGGITGATHKNGSGCTCHGKLPTPSVNVLITGPDTLVAGDSAEFTVTITGGPLVRGGTDIASRKGTLIPEAGLRTLNGELTHMSPFVPVNNVVTIHFRYKAPSLPGIDTLFANGNSVNFNSFSTGDNWNFAPEKYVTIKSSTGIYDQGSDIRSYKLNQNYPNPFNPMTSINFNLQRSGFAKLVVYDISGKQIDIFADRFLPAGSHIFRWNAGNSPSGIYFYKLEFEGNTETKKMILNK